MDGRTFGFYFYPEFISLTDHFRRSNLNFRELRYHHSISACAHRLQRSLHLHIFFFHMYQLTHGMDQLIFALHLNPAHLAEHLIIIFISDPDSDLHRSIRKSDFFQQGILHIRTGKLYGFLCDIPDMKQIFHLFPDLGKKLLFQLMIHWKHFHPFRNKKLNLTDRKFVEYVFHDTDHIFFAELVAVYSERSHLIFLLNFFRCF